MPAPPRSRGRRERRGGDPDERLRRILESQQAAYEASRAVLAVAAARRDVEWREAAEANRRRAVLAVGAPVLVGVVIMILGLVVLPLVFVGGAAVVLWTVLMVRIWRRAGSGVLRGLGGVSSADATARGTISSAEAERLADITDGLCAALGLGVPAIMIIDDPSPNALAFGRGPDDATLVLTAGAAHLLDRIELEAVLAHELVHVKRLDVLTAALAASGLGAAGDVLSGGRFGIWLHGQDRETRADLAAVAVTRYPPGLMSALERIADQDDGGSQDRLVPVEPSPGPLPSSSQSGVPAGRARERTEMSWLAPLPRASGRLGQRRASELADRLDVLREL